MGVGFFRQSVPQRQEAVFPGDGPLFLRKEQQQTHEHHAQWQEHHQNQIAAGNQYSKHR